MRWVQASESDHAHVVSLASIDLVKPQKECLLPAQGNALDRRSPDIHAPVGLEDREHTSLEIVIGQTDQESSVPERGAGIGEITVVLEQADAPAGIVQEPEFIRGWHLE